MAEVETQSILEERLSDESVEKLEKLGDHSKLVINIEMHQPTSSTIAPVNEPSELNSAIDNAIVASNTDGDILQTKVLKSTTTKIKEIKEVGHYTAQKPQTSEQFPTETLSNESNMVDRIAAQMINLETQMRDLKTKVADISIKVNEFNDTIDVHHDTALNFQEGLTIEINDLKSCLSNIETYLSVAGEAQYQLFTAIFNKMGYAGDLSAINVFKYKKVVTTTSAKKTNLFPEPALSQLMQLVSEGKANLPPEIAVSQSKQLVSE